MKQIVLSAFVILPLLLGGCAASTSVKEQIRNKSVEQGNVFRELTDRAPMQGFSVLIIWATIKTPKEGFYPLESKAALHGKPKYPFVFNIGGQGVIWLAKGTHDTQKELVDGKKNPEGGEGVKYILDKKVTLRPGTYKIYLGLTEEAFQKEIELNITEGKRSILEFKPVYRRDRISGCSFYMGISDFDVYLDGKEIHLP